MKIGVCPLFKDGKREKVTKYDTDGATILTWTKFQYDSLGRLALVKQPIDLSAQPETTAVTTFDYQDITSGDPGWTFTGDPVTYDKRMTDAEGKERYEAHDSQGRLIKIRYPDGDAQDFVYDEKGRKTEQSVFVNSGAGYTKEKISYEYYQDGKLKRKTYPDGS